MAEISPKKSSTRQGVDHSRLPNRGGKYGKLAIAQEPERLNDEVAIDFPPI